MPRPWILGETLTSREALESWRVTHHCETNASRQTEVILPVLCAQAWFVWHATCCLNSCLFLLRVGLPLTCLASLNSEDSSFTLQLTALADQEASVVLMPFMPQGREFDPAFSTHSPFSRGLRQAAVPAVTTAQA